MVEERGDGVACETFGLCLGDLCHDSKGGLRLAGVTKVSERREVVRGFTTMTILVNTTEMV